MRNSAEKLSTRDRVVSRLSMVPAGVLCSALALIYFAAAKLSLLLAIEGYASPVWLPTGIAVAALFLGGIRLWPGVFIGAFISNWQVDGASQIAIQIAIGNTLEAVMAIWLTSRLLSRRYLLNQSRSVFIFALIILGASSISALIGGLAVVGWPLSGTLNFELFSEIWTTWWVGDAVGAFVFAPLIMAYAQKYRFIRRSNSEYLFFIVATLILLEAIFGGLSVFQLNSAPFAFLPLPLMVAVGYRLGLKGVVVFTLLLSIISITGTFKGYGPFVQDEVSLSLVLLQVYIGCVSLSGLLLCSIIAEREGARRALLRLSGHLEGRVSRATDELREANITLGDEKQRQQSLIEELITSEGRYRALFDNAAEAIVLFDMEHNHFVDVNENAEALFGYTREQILAIPCDELSPELQRNGRASTELGIINCEAAYLGDPVCFEWLHLHADGHLIPCEVRLVAFPSREGQLIRASITDISERLQSSARQRLISKVFENTTEGVIITDAQLRIVEVNQAYCEITGYAASDVYGTNPNWMLSDDENTDITHILWQQVAEEGRWHGEVLGKRKDGSRYPKLLTVSAVSDEKGIINNYLGQFSDISDFKIKEDRLVHLANYDLLTGLYNRTAFLDHMNRMIEIAKRDASTLSVYFIDLDGFKRVNDSLGHDAGDSLLRDVANRLQNTLRKTDLVARLGGDEFTVVGKHSGTGEKQRRLVTKLIKSLTAPYQVAGSEIHLSVSIGISNYPYDGVDCKLLLKNADIAMYQAKKAGRDGYQFFTNQMNIAALSRMNVEIGLRKALERKEFVLHYQPQIDLKSGQLVGFEALIRWQHPEKGLLAPGEFIEVAEQSGLIAPIGRWVLEEACIQNREWQKLGVAEVPIAINLSARQFRFPKELLSHVRDVIEKSQLAPSLLELELTESMLVENVELAIDTLKSLRQVGIKLAIDDFGTGYSSLAYLKRFDADKLKIDRSFVSELEADSDDAAIVKATIALGHSLNLKVIAEGVETEAQTVYLRECGCDEIQGYLISRPLPASAVPAMVELLEMQSELVEA